MKIRKLKIQHSGFSIFSFGFCNIWSCTLSRPTTKIQINKLNYNKNSSEKFENKAILPHFTCMFSVSLLTPWKLTDIISEGDFFKK